MQNLFSNTLGNRYVDPKMRLANLLMKQGTDTSPIAHPMQGVSRLASTLAGLYGANQSKKDRGEALQAFARQQGPVADVEKITAPSDEALLNDPAVQALLGKYNEQQAVADDVSNVAVPATNAEDLYNAPSRKLEEFGDEKILNNLGRAIRGDGPQATDSIDDFKTASAMATADRMREPTEQFGEKDFMQLLNQVNSEEGPPQNWMRGQSGKLSSNLRNPVSPASIVPERVAPRPDYEQQMADKINQLRDQRTVREMVPGKPQMSAMDFAIKNLTGLPDNPYAQERLANLLNTKMAVSEQDRLWNRNRGAEVEDRDLGSSLTREGWDRKAPVTKTVNLGNGLKRDDVWNPQTQEWVIGESYDPSLKSEGAQNQALQRSIAGRPTWTIGTDAKGNPMQVSSTGEVKSMPAPKLSKGQEAVDREYGKHYSKFYATGQIADAMKNLSQLGAVSKRLKDVDEGKSDENLTGPILGRAPDFVKSFTNPDSIAVREDVEEVVQRNLRVILGAQFTEKEGVRLIARAYNPNLDEGINHKRISRLIKAMRNALEMQNKAGEYFEENGTLRGFKGTTEFSILDLSDAMDDTSLDGKGSTGDKNRRSTDSITEKEQRELDQLRKEVGSQ